MHRKIKMKIQELSTIVSKLQPLMKPGLELIALTINDVITIQLIGKNAPKSPWKNQRGYALLEANNIGILFWTPSTLTVASSVTDLEYCYWARCENLAEAEAHLCTVWGPALFCSALEFLVTEAPDHAAS
jgi:hypothetical protein